MKFDWKYWLPHFITWFLLLILIGCCSWLINEERKRLKIKNLSYNIKSSGSSKGGIDFLGGGNKKTRKSPPKEDNGEPDGEEPSSENKDCKDDKSDDK